MDGKKNWMKETGCSRDKEKTTSKSKAIKRWNNDGEEMERERGRDERRCRKRGELLCHIIFGVCVGDSSLSPPTHFHIIYKLQPAAGQHYNKTASGIMH